MSKVWFTSDLHIGHKLVAASRYRKPDGAPFFDDYHALPGWFDDSFVARHDQILAEAWDYSVGEDDVVWVLGDISSGTNDSVHRALKWIADRPGTKHLISGNHCPTHPMHRDSYKWQPIFLDAFASVQPYARRRVPLANGRQDVLLCHFPYEDKHTGIGNAGLYGQYRMPNEGLPILHGHTHSRQKVSRCTIPTWNGDTRLSHTLQIHVGIDAWASLCPLEWIVAQVQAEVGISPTMEA